MTAALVLMVLGMDASAPAASQQGARPTATIVPAPIPALCSTLVVYEPKPEDPVIVVAWEHKGPTCTAAPLVLKVVNRSSQPLPEAYLTFSKPVGEHCPELWATSDQVLAVHPQNRGLGAGEGQTLTLSGQALHHMDDYQRRCAPGQPFTVKLEDLAARDSTRKAVERRLQKAKELRRAKR